jgi:uncharacterized membrane protein YeaQ/YmgE (transglycosylase-associated protein family)
MIGMNFWAFLAVSVAAVLAAAVIHYVVRYRFLEGFDGFLAKVFAGWVGAWLGSPVIGHWFGRAKIANVYLIPALLGALAGAFAVAATAKAAAKANAATMISGAESHETRKAA